MSSIIKERNTMSSTKQTRSSEKPSNSRTSSKTEAKRNLNPSKKPKRAPVKKKAKKTEHKSRTPKTTNISSKIERELSPWQELDADYLEGIAGVLFPKSIEQIKSGEELSIEELKKLSKNLLKSEVGQNLFAFIADKQRAHEKLNMTLDDYAKVFAKCSRGEFNKRVRRAEDEIELFGTPDYIGTLNNAALDALNSIHFNNTKTAMVDTFKALMAKQEADKNFDITAPEVNSTKLELFPITEHSKGETQQSTKNGNAVEGTSEPTDSKETTKEQNKDESTPTKTIVKSEETYSTKVISTLDNFIKKAKKAEIPVKELKAVKKILKPINNEIKALLDSFED